MQHRLRHSLAALALSSWSCLAAEPASPSAIPTVIPIPGPTRWDYLSVDSAAHRLYLAHGEQTELVDTRTDRLVGQLAQTRGVHGIALANGLGRVFSSDGSSGEIGVYENGRRTASIKAGANPDAIVFEPLSQRVVAFNGRSRDLTVADARTLAVVAAALPVGGKPEFAVLVGRGQIAFNVEDTAEIAVLDAATARIVKRYSIAPCDSPTGLDADSQGRLYSVCGNRLMVISDPATGRVLGQAAIGAGADGVVLMDGRAYSANGRDGTVSVVAETAPGRFETVATLPTAPGARTIAADLLLHKLYLPTADFQATAASGAGRGMALPDSFKLLVLQLP